MADFKIKPSAGVSNKLILQTQDETDVLTTSASGVAITAPTITDLSNITGTIPVGVTIATGVHGKYVLEDYDKFYYGSETSSTTENLTNLNISGTNYVTVVTGTSTSDILEFIMDYGTVYGNPDSNGGHVYLGFSLTRSTASNFVGGLDTLWRSGEHGWGGHDRDDYYHNFHMTKSATVSDFGFSASSTYYVRLAGMTHSAVGTFTFGKTGNTNRSTSNIAADGVRLTYRRWRLV